MVKYLENQYKLKLSVIRQSIVKPRQASGKVVINNEFLRRQIQQTIKIQKLNLDQISNPADQLKTQPAYQLACSNQSEDSSQAEQEYSNIIRSIYHSRLQGPSSQFSINNSSKVMSVEDMYGSKLISGKNTLVLPNIHTSKNRANKAKPGRLVPLGQKHSPRKKPKNALLVSKINLNLKQHTEGESGRDGGWSKEDAPQSSSNSNCKHISSTLNKDTLVPQDTQPHHRSNLSLNQHPATLGIARGSIPNPKHAIRNDSQEDMRKISQLGVQSSNQSGISNRNDKISGNVEGEADVRRAGSHSPQQKFLQYLQTTVQQRKQKQ